jgi:hypothetical protein
MTMKRILLAALVLSIAGCTQARDVYTPDGRRGAALRCPAAWAGCFEKAGQMCGSRGYDVFARDNTTGQVAAINYTPGVGLQGFSTSQTNRELLIACKVG